MRSPRRAGRAAGPGGDGARRRRRAVETWSLTRYVGLRAHHRALRGARRAEGRLRVELRGGHAEMRAQRRSASERELGYALLDARLRRAAPGAGGHDALRAGRGAPRDDDLSASAGSGLNNALYLRPGAAVLQIVPFGLRYRGDFEGIATRNGVSYGELVLEDRRRSVFHWEFLDPERLVAGRAAVLDAGSPPGGREVYGDVRVNQDVVVPRAAFLGAVRGAAAIPLNRRLLEDGVSRDPEHTV